MPLPGRADNIIQIAELRFPPQLLNGFLIGCHQHGGITGPTMSVYGFNVLCRNLFYLIDYLEHRIPLTLSEIKGAAFASIEQVFKCQYMGPGQVGDMNVISDAYQQTISGVDGIWTINVADPDPNPVPRQPE